MKCVYNSVVEAVFRHAEKAPELLCIADTKASYTYAGFAELCRRMCGVFRTCGIGKGDRVVVEAVQRAEFLAAEFGLHLLGGVFVPLESRCTAQKLASVAVSCEAKLIIARKPGEAAAQTACMSWDELMKAAQETEPDAYAFPDREDVSEILFSTGTTGKEKGIVITHGNDIAVAGNICGGVQMREGNVEMIPSPLNHSHGLRSAYADLVGGGGVVLVDSLMNLKRFFEMMDRFGVNSMDLVPAALSVILRNSGDKLGEYRDRLRYIEFGSAPMAEADRVKIRSLLPGVPLYNFYGSTESGRTTVYNFNTDAPKDKCIGRPTANTQIVMTDSDRKIIESDREHTGLIACRGGMNMPYYWNDPEETARVTDGDLIYTNDEAYYDEDGDIILLGRVGDVINIGGKKVSPDEIEDCAKEMPEVADCGCIAVDDDVTGKAALLFVQCSPGSAFDGKAIREHLLSRLESFKVPKYIQETDQIPRSFNGKLLRRELRRRLPSE